MNENTPVMIPTRRGGDPYSVSPDGHFIGHDGFVVPKTFAEFHERFPRHVPCFVRRRTPQATEEAKEELIGALREHLMSLPEESRFRVAGATDRIQCFSPDRAYGASAARFFCWLNRCLWHRLYKISGQEVGGA